MQLLRLEEALVGSAFSAFFLKTITQGTYSCFLEVEGSCGRELRYLIQGLAPTARCSNEAI